MEAIILAGGFGTRLQSHIKGIPKPMAEIGGVPFLQYLITYLSRNNINKIILSVGYMHSMIENYFGSKFENSTIEYIVEEDPLGTGGAIREAVKSAHNGNLFIVNGDSFFHVNLNELFNFHSLNNSLLTLSLKKLSNYDRYGTIILDDNRVVGFKEKSHNDSGYINGGIYAVSRDIGRYLDGYDSNFSFETEFLQNKYDELRIFGFISDGYFIDIGTPEDYIKAQKELKSVFKRIIG